VCNVIYTGNEKYIQNFNCNFLNGRATWFGRPKLRWEDDVSEDIKSLNVRNWKNETQDRERWKKVVEQARTLYRL